MKAEHEIFAPERKSIASRNQLRPFKSESYVNRRRQLIIKFFRKEAKMFNDWKLLTQTDEIPKPIIKATQILLENKTNKGRELKFLSSLW